MTGHPGPQTGLAPAKRVLLLTHRSPEVTREGLREVLRVLEAEGVEPIVSAAETIKHPELKPFQSNAAPTFGPGGEDLILVLGGDGSLLRALSREAASGAAIMGINFGRVGFLASIERDDVEQGLRRALRGEYTILTLPSLRAEWSEGRIDSVNDLALLRGGEARIADMTYAVDGEPVATLRCDGLVCSTPVGSTAYNLAAGGPTVSWRVPCFVVSFIAAHHLDTRPLVIGAEESLTVTNTSVVDKCDMLSDGQLVGALRPGQSTTITLTGPGVHLGIFPEASFFRRYREKFGRPVST